MKFIFPMLAVLLAGLLLSACTPQTPETSIPNTDVPEEIPEVGFCTMDAKICPDGSAVGRVPPNCEFAPCPGPVPEPDGGIECDTSSEEYVGKNPQQCSTIRFVCKQVKNIFQMRADVAAEQWIQMMELLMVRIAHLPPLMANCKLMIVLLRKKKQKSAQRNIDRFAAGMILRKFSVFGIPAHKHMETNVKHARMKM